MAKKKSGGVPIFKIALLILILVLAMYTYKNYSIHISSKKDVESTKVEKVVIDAVNSVKDKAEEIIDTNGKTESNKKEIESEKKATNSKESEVAKKFKPTGDTKIEVGLELVKDRKGVYKLKNRGHTFKADKKSGLAKVYIYSYIVEKKSKDVYFYFNNGKGVEKKSKSFSVSYNPNGYKVWVWKNLTRGRWKVSVRDVSTDVVLAKKGFMIR